MDSYIGELAALGTAVSWSMTSLFFAMSGRLVGSSIVNRVRLMLALVMVSVFHWITRGELIPIDAEGYRWGWFALSGFIGFVLGDALLFQAFVLIGARLSMLLLSLAPVLSVFLGWTLLHESLSAQQLFGVALVVSGVVWVVTDRPPANGEGVPQQAAREYAIGLLFGLGGAVGQAVGLIASKQGLQDDFSPVSGNLMRLLVATIFIWGFTLLNGQAWATVGRLRAQPRAMTGITLGSLVGPFIGVTLSLLAVQHAPVGIASTLMALPPVLLLPAGYLLYREQIGIRAVLGTALAVVGTGVIFLR